MWKMCAKQVFLGCGEEKTSREGCGKSHKSINRDSELFTGTVILHRKCRVKWEVGVLEERSYRVGFGGIHLRGVEVGAPAPGPRSKRRL